MRGPGGSHDILAMLGVRAILPGYHSNLGEQIWLAGGNGLAAGWYTLLSARYAALPGAYAAMATGGAPSAAMSKSYALVDGSVIMAGRRANPLTGTEDQLNTTWRILSGKVQRSYTEYNEAFANSFFASDTFKQAQHRLTAQEIVTPRLPNDGGAVVFKATQELILDGQLTVAGRTRRPRWFG